MRPESPRIRFAAVARWAVAASAGVLVCLPVFPQTRRPDRLLVRLDRAVTTSGARTGLPDLDAVLSRYGALAVRPAFRFDPSRNAALKSRFGFDRTVAIELPPGSDLPGAAADLARLSVVEAVETDVVGRGGSVPPNDTHYVDQWHLRNTGQTGGTPGADVEAEGGWAVTTGSSSIVVAVLDTGIDSAHPEFAGRLIAGYDFVNNDPDPEADNSHGTLVAGIALANANNALQVAGVDWAARLMPIKVLDENNLGVTSDLVNGILFAADHGADVLNMSLIDYPCSGSLRNAVQYARAAGAVPVAASGNGGLGDADLSGPGCIPEAISVGATTQDDRRASFSGTGAALDVVAPGQEVRTVTYRAYSDGTTGFSGTSASAPVVSGLCALLRAADPTLTPDEIQNLVESNSDDRIGPARDDPAGRDANFGWGRVNLKETLGAVSPAPLRRGLARPKSLGVGATATFSVVFTSGAGLPPDFVRLVLDGPESGIFAMVPSTTAHTILRDGSFANGEQYDAAVPLRSTGLYRFHFETAVEGSPSRYPATGELPGPQVTLLLAEDVAASEQSVASSTVSGDFRSTYFLDNDPLVLDEVLSSGSPAQRYSHLDHRFTFQVTGGDSVSFLVNAGRVVFWPAEDDRYLFSYSVNGGSTWTPMLTVAATDPGQAYQTFAMPQGTSGTVLVRVEDTDHTPGNTGIDRLFIDQMIFRSQAAPTPGEARDLRVTAYDRVTGKLSLSWTPACAAADHNIVFGPLASVSSYGYSGQVCGAGSAGAFSGFDPGPGSWFFLVIGTDGSAVEGSYGTDSSGRERPEQTNDPVCHFTRDLHHRCDGF